MQIKGIMVLFSFLKEIFFGIGDAFQWILQFLPPIGIYANWFFVAVIIGLLVYWCTRIFAHTTKDHRWVDNRREDDKLYMKEKGHLN